MLVSIITTFYYGTEYLPALLKSIQENAVRCKRHGIDIEHIIVNDSPDIKFTIEDRDSFKVRIYDNERNMGIHASRITGVGMAKGKYIIFLDQDDTLAPGAVLSHMAVMHRRDGRLPAVSVGNGYWVDKKTRHRETIYKNIWYHGLCNRMDTVICYGTIIISPGQCMIRKSAIPNEWLSYPVKQSGSDDELLWLTMLARGCFFAVNKRYIYNHLTTGENTSDDVGRIADSSLEGIKLLKKCPGFTHRQLRLFYRRRKMKKERYQKSMPQKMWVNFKNPDLSLYIIGVKLLKSVPWRR